MSITWVRWAALAVAVLGSACSSSDSDGISVSWGSASEPSELGDFAPDPGYMFFAGNVTVSNAGSKQAPLDPTDFTLTTVSGIGYVAESYTVTNPCTADLVVEPGFIYTCALVFVIETTDTPDELVYTMPDGSTYSGDATYY